MSNAARSLLIFQRYITKIFLTDFECQLLLWLPQEDLSWFWVLQHTSKEGVEGQLKSGRDA